MVFEDIADYVIECARDADYSDVRAEVFNNTSIVVIDGAVHRCLKYVKKGASVRVIVKGSWGFQSTTDLTKPGLKRAVERAMAMAHAEAVKTKEPVKLEPIKICEDTVRPTVEIDFRDMALEDKINLNLEWNKSIKVGSEVVRAITRYETIDADKYFTNSEGTRIHFIRPIIGVNLIAFGKGPDGVQSYLKRYGGTGGHELLDGGDLTTQAEMVGRKSIALSKAKPAPEMCDTQVVFDPSYMALLVHEIVGHPSEADRVIGRESAWAGTAWWKGMEGQKIGSDYVTAYDDPTVEGAYGFYLYDDEGTPARRKVLLDKGVITERMHSRETASIFGVKPNAGMRSNTYEYFPIIRMSNTFWGTGDWKAEEIIEDTKEGVYVVGWRNPSIDDTRYQWAISSQEGWLIKNGELTTHLKGCLVTATSPVFFKSINALANDLIFKISECGKGDPSQCSTVGNGGPHMRGKATLVGRR